MIIMFNVTSPLNKGVEVTKTFLKTVETSPPPYLRSRGVYTTYSEEGYRWYNIVEIDDVHIQEGFTELMKRKPEIYINVNNHYEGSAPKTIERILNLLKR